MKWRNNCLLCLLVITFVQQGGTYQKNNKEGMQMASIGIESGIAKRHADLLNQLLANEFVLYTKTLNFHWNVKGKWFGALHTFFQNQYEQLASILDIVAEQIQILGFETIASLQDFMKLKTVSEEPIHTRQDTEMLKVLLALQEAIIEQIRSMLTEISETNNYALENVLQDILTKHEKMHWMIQAHLN
jgi:starvation-inducible DNA-binding protein